MLPDEIFVAEYELGKASYKIYRARSIYTDGEDYDILRDNERVQSDLSAEATICYLCNALHNVSHMLEDAATKVRTGE